MERPLSAMEKRFWLLDRINATHLVLVAEVDGNATIERWRNAIDHVQSRHPLLNVAVRLQSDGSIVFVRQDAPIPIYKLSDRLNWEEYVAAELSTPFDTEVAPLLRIGLAASDNQTILIVTAHHATADGMSAVTIVRDIIAAINGATLMRLQTASSLEDLMTEAPDETVAAARSDAGIGKLRSLNPERGGTPPAIERIEFSDRLTTRLRQYFNRAGTTVQGALCAACVASQLQREPDSGPLIIVSPIDAKRRFGVEGTVGVHLAAKTIPVEISAGSAFWETARLFSGELAQAATRSAIEAQQKSLRSVFAQNDLDAATDVLIKGRARDIMMTNLGVIPEDSNGAELRLRRLWGPLAFSGHPGEHTVGAVTTMGHLTICIGSRTLMHGFAVSLVQALASACGYEISWMRRSGGALYAGL